MIVLVLLSWYSLTKNKNYIENTNTIDFEFNNTKIDSIYKNINKTDSLINNIKRFDSIKYETIWNLSDSSSVELFYKLSKGR